MVLLKKEPDLKGKLQVLSQDSQYDLACACSLHDYEHRKRSEDNKWIYPVTFEDGRKTFLFKTLLSNVCVNDCKYCPLRSSMDPERVTLKPEELASSFFKLRKTGMVNGLFLSSGVIGSADNTMEKINTTARILRRTGFRGYIHLKVIPGASDAAIEDAVSLASAVSVNIESAGEKHFSQLSESKNYIDDVIRPIKLISSLTEKGTRYGRVKQTTQFVVGASDETDNEFVRYTWRLYKKLGLSRVYFSAYQRGLGDRLLPGELSSCSNKDILMREHRLYQVDWLIRKYKFNADEIPFDGTGNLSLTRDPKEMWALRHPDFFPVNINSAGKFDLLRVPGLGHIAVNRILDGRKKGMRYKRLSDIGKPGRLLKKADPYIIF
ncbi:radical SAM protein [Elusimicrobiota bacterium]